MSNWLDQGLSLSPCLDGVGHFSDPEMHVITAGFPVKILHPGFTRFQAEKILQLQTSIS